MTEPTSIATPLFVRRPDIFYTLVDGELIIMSSDEEKFLTSNAVAAKIWERLESPVSVEDLCAAVLARFRGGDRSTVKTDIEEFLAALKARNLLMPAS